MDQQAQVMVIEGDCPLECVDLVVFVARLPTPGASLLRRVARDQAADRLLGGTGKHRLDPELVEQVRRHYVNAPPEAAIPAADEKWQTAPGYADIEKAGLVIGWRGSRVPITAVAGNVLDPKDAGLKKALARVKRAVRSAG